MTKTELKKQMQQMGIKIYRNKKTNALLAKKGDIRKALAKLGELDEVKKKVRADAQTEEFLKEFVSKYDAGQIKIQFSNDAFKLTGNDISANGNTLLLEPTVD